MERNTRATRAAGVILFFLLVMFIIVSALYFLEFIILGSLIIVLGILILFAIIVICIAFLMIPMYIIKDTIIETGDYQIDSNVSVENRMGGEIHSKNEK